MKRLLIVASLALAACTPTPTIPPAPAVIADRTPLDEQAAIGVELAYMAARLAIKTATDAGLIRGQRATTIAALDNCAYAAVNGVRAAYRAGNALSYSTALSEAQAAVNAVLAAIRGA